MSTTPRRPATEAEAKAVASAFRLRILRLCLDEPRTNKQIAEALGANPATVLHHVRRLVETGFLAPQHPRRGARGAREIPYLSTRKSWEIELPWRGEQLVEAFLGEFERARDRTDANLAWLGLRLTDDEFAQLNERIQAMVDELAAQPPSPTGRPYSLFFSLQPDVDREAARPPADR